jgi:cbb3-type cytochrome oxidase maturation protein
MSVIFVVLPMAVILAGLAVWAFIWAARQGQFDDVDTPAYRVAQEDD